MSYLDKYFSHYITVHRTSYSTQQVLIGLLAEWKGRLDKIIIVGTVLMDLSKAFNSTPCDMTVAEMAPYGIERENLRLSYS